MNIVNKLEKGRFEFGKNWQKYLEILNEQHINEAEKSLKQFLGVEDLSGKRFLDIGSGSGLHSLVACRIGATVFSFDYDDESVACTNELRHRYFSTDNNWKVERGSILDRDYIESLGEFDISYAWGVLHHTGGLWQAIYNSQKPLKVGGEFFVAIYNDQGFISSVWKLIKKTYCSGWLGQLFMSLIFYPVFFFTGLFIDLFHLQNPILRYRNHKKYRGMSLLHDWRDWLGGYPYEPANPIEIIDFLRNLGLELIKFEPTNHGFGNNQFLFKKIR